VADWVNCNRNRSWGWQNKQKNKVRVFRVRERQKVQHRMSVFRLPWSTMTQTQTAN
jgi:hypothetical protein